MQLGEVIRKYRKEKNITQEEMADRLGVTAPAVNKWENGKSLPDIMLLAPIARLLGVSPDTLLSFKEELTQDEINSMIKEADERLTNGSYDEAFQWAKKKLECYPNCTQLIWQMALVFDARRLTEDIPDSEQYDGYIRDCYVRALDSGDESVRSHAADSLFGFYSRKEQYEKAEEYLVYFSEENPEKKRKQAFIYSKTNRIEEAYKAYEELLFSGYQMLNLVFGSIYMLAMEGKDRKKAHEIVNKQAELAKLFEMGKYYEVSCKLELAMVEQDADTTIEIAEEMLASIGDMMNYTKSALYEHMQFREVQEEFYTNLKKNLLKCFRDDETFGFLKEDKRWQELGIFDN